MDSDRFTINNQRAGRILAFIQRPIFSSLLLWLAPLIFLALFYFYPLSSILSISFARGEGGIIASFKEALLSPSVRNIIWFTFWQATVSTILTLALGLPGAYLLARYEFKGKSLIKALTGISFVLPTLVVAAAFNALLGPQGLVNASLMSIFSLDSPPIMFTNTLLAILVAHVFYNTTIVLRLVGDFWAHIDPRISQAATVLGAKPWQTAWQITIPLLLPAIASAALLVFIFTFTSFGVILVLGGPHFSTLETEIYYQTVSLFNLPLAATLALIQLTITLVLTIIYTRLITRISRPLSLHPIKYTQKRLTTWTSRVFAGIMIGTLLILIITPLAALAMRSVSKFERGDSASARQGYGTPVWSGFTLDNYRELSINRRESLFYSPPITTIGVSLGYAAATVLLALLLGLPAAWALSRNGKFAINRVLDPLLMLPLGTSAVTLGLGFIVALDHPPLDLRASILLIPLAHTLVAFPFVMRSLAPSLSSISPHLRQAAAVLGAKPSLVFRQIDLPLIGRALLVAAIFAFTISLGEFGATALIARPEYPTIPLAIYRLITRPGATNYGQALALSTILMLVAGAGMLAIERFRIAEIGEF
jgi:thiamine transport system permease protein